MLLGGSIQGEFDNERVAIWGDQLFVLRREVPVPPGERTELWRIGTDGSNATSLDQLEGRPRSITVNADFVYYTGTTSGIYRLPRDASPGDPPELVAANGTVIHVGDSLYYKGVGGDGEGLYRSDLDGQNAALLVAVADDVQQIHADVSAVYYTVFLDGLYRLDFNSSVPVKLSQSSNGEAIAFSFQGSRIYYVTFFGRAASVLTDGTDHQFYGPNNPNTAANSSTIDSNYFYWGNGPSSLNVRRLSLMTGIIEAYGPYSGATKSMTSDADHLYTASFGALWSIPKCSETTPL